MKVAFRFFFQILLFVTAQTAIAQNMQAVTKMLNQQNMQFQMRLMLMDLSMLNTSDINRKVDFMVTMTDSSQIFVRSKIYSDTVKHQNYLTYVDKKCSRSDSNRNKKIYVGQTLSIACNLTKLYGAKDNWYKGIAKDSCWMFKAISGNINAYSMLSQPDGSQFNPYTLVAVQKGDGPIVKLTPDNLTQMVEQDDKALDYIKNKKYYKAIKKYNSNVEKAAKK
jgi:hypothetical protein